MFVGANDPGDTVVISGNPNLTLTIPGGTHGDIATAAVVVNLHPGNSRRPCRATHFARSADVLPSAGRHAGNGNFPQTAMKSREERKIQAGDIFGPALKCCCN